MTTISDKDRADAQAMAETLAGQTLIAHTDDDVRRWLAVRDRAFASHACEQAWRPTTRDEIQLGWEVRSRYSGGMEATWGVAHRRGAGGDWLTEWDRLLTWDDMGWTCETTAPLPEPEPEPDQRVGLLEGVCLREGVVLTRSDAALLLSIADAAERPKAGA